MEKVQKRTRRSKVDLDANLLNAAKEVIKEVGFNNATVVGISEKAKVQTSVFYNRYEDLNKLFSKLVREYDYWMDDAIQFDPVNVSPIQNYTNLLVELVNSLLENEVMQELLIWEISSDNYITRRSSASREVNTKYMLDYFGDNFKNSEIDVNIITALLVSGVYYLILRKERSTFCSVDFNKKENIEALCKNIILIVKKLFDNSSVVPSSETKKNKMNTQVIQIARNFLKSGVDIETIQNCTGLSAETITLIADNEEVVDNLINDNINSSNDFSQQNVVSVKRRGRKPKSNVAVTAVDSSFEKKRRGRKKKISN